MNINAYYLLITIMNASNMQGNQNNFFHKQFHKTISKEYKKYF